MNKKILEIKNEINNKKYELYELKLNITKTQNVYNSNTKYYNILLKQIQAEKDKTNCLAYEISKEKDLLKKREDYLKKISNNIENKNTLNNFLKPKLKLNINCIYYDNTIDGSDEASGSYEFFKYLKNSITGVFLGIKTQEDLHYALAQLSKSQFKFVLIFRGNDNDKIFLEGNKDYFFHIIIFAIESSEIRELRKIENVSIESEYYNIIMKLKEIEKTYKTDMKLVEKYKPYNLNLYSDYLIFDNIQKCHQTLLNKTILNQNLDKINQELFYQGLDENEVNEFIAFLNSLEDEDSEENQNFPNNDNNITNIENEAIPVKAQIINNRTEKAKNSGINKIHIEDIKGNIRFNSNDNFLENVKEIKESSLINIRDDELNFDFINFINNNNNPKKNSISKLEKALIIEFLKNNNIKNNKNLAKLYSLEEPKFYEKINEWLRSLDFEIYKKISTIAGKLTNLIYSNIHSRNISQQKDIRSPLYRGFSIKKADIFLYKACEGDIFCYPSFTSMSSAEETSKKFGKTNDIDNSDLGNKCACIIELDYQLKNGCYVQEYKFENNCTEFPGENERLFPPFSFFKIKKVKFWNKDLNEKKFFDGTNDNPFRIELEIINRNFYLDQAILMKKNLIIIKMIIFGN